LAWTAEDISTLEDAIRARKGARSIAFSDQVVTFESLSDMREFLAEMRREVSATAGRPHTRFGAYSKGC
jgi:hypothetical protein